MSKLSPDLSGLPRFGGHKLFSKLLARRASNHFCSPILIYIPKMSLQIVDSSLLRMMTVEGLLLRTLCIS
ncbi:unnamed protein product [Musa acuminata subsp. burmannicoides]